MMSDKQDRQQLGLEEIKRMLHNQKSRLEETEKKKASNAFMEDLEERLQRFERRGEPVTVEANSRELWDRLKKN